MNTYRTMIAVGLLGLTAALSAQHPTNSGWGSAQQLNKNWVIESESPDYRLQHFGDTLEISAPKGFTLWRKEQMHGDICIEYDACVMDEGKPGDRLSDLNCFWMASDPASPDKLSQRGKWRNGIFKHYYTMKMYYLGYGGNHNTTTRFRRYDGNFEKAQRDSLPPVICEYTDPDHLLKAGKWVHISIRTRGIQTTYTIDGQRLVDYRDPHPLRSGWFGFRTTQARVRLANFKYTNLTPDDSRIPLQWIGHTPQRPTAVSFGVPFAKGAVQPAHMIDLTGKDGTIIPTNQWVMAYWPDGSVKWKGVTTVIPAGADSLTLHVSKSMRKATKYIHCLAKETANGMELNTGRLQAYFSKSGETLLDSIVLDGVRVGGKARLHCSTTQGDYTGHISRISLERNGSMEAVVKVEGMHVGGGRQWLPFTVRFYAYAGSAELKMVHSFVFDGDQDKDFIRALGVAFEVPLREAVYNRHVAFADTEGGVWSEPAQPLTGRRMLTQKGDYRLYQKQIEGQRMPPYEEFDQGNRTLIDHWASWDGYRLSQLDPNGFSIRKRTQPTRPWIGTVSGKRAAGVAFAGDVSGGLVVGLRDFWQSYPSTLQIDGMRGEMATLDVWLWSPESEPMDLRHYDTVAHDLNASYEDVQEGLSTPYGVARTSIIMLEAMPAYCGNEQLAARAAEWAMPRQLICAPDYLQRMQAFGVWSLPDRSTPMRAAIEDRLDAVIDYYKLAQEQHGWYGFWNYGDFMHAYDPARHSWRYDIGGFAWDNTELASNSWLWYSFLRTGREDIWRLAEAMTRHTTEVDVYHLGPLAGLGSRHNVSHWGCGSKEARISQAAWNRFYYYLTTDDRSGDLMSEVADADTLLYTLDPMRLAEPRERFPTNAKARLRIGPDWIAYAGNWMTEWERTRNTKYRDKLLTGMKSIGSLPDGFFTGNQALDYDPETGTVSYHGDPARRNTSHLMTIQGGFEINHELMQMCDVPEWCRAWLDHALRYPDMAMKVSRSRFMIPRLTAYAAYMTGNADLRRKAWNDWMPNIFSTGVQPFEVHQVLPPTVLYPQDENMFISTNDAAVKALDAIYMLEVIPPDM